MYTYFTVLLEKRHSLQALTAMQADKKIEKKKRQLRVSNTIVTLYCYKKFWNNMPYISLNII